MLDPVSLQVVAVMAQNLIDTHEESMWDSIVKVNADRKNAFKCGRRQGMQEISDVFLRQLEIIYDLNDECPCPELDFDRPDYFYPDKVDEHWDYEFLEWMPRRLSLQDTINSMGTFTEEQVWSIHNTMWWMFWTRQFRMIQMDIESLNK